MNDILCPSGFVQIRTMDPMFNLAHRDGVPWVDAPCPKRWHLCSPQTIGAFGFEPRIERCACGAFRRGNAARWRKRNSRGRASRRHLLAVTPEPTDTEGSTP